MARIAPIPAAVLLALLCASPASRGAEEPGGGRLTGLLVRETDTPANSLLRQADALKAKGAYADALAGYQEVLRSFPSSLFPVTPETLEGRAGVTYVSVQEYVETQMGLVPESAREGYASLYEGLARVLVESGLRENRREDLEKAARLYPIAPSGIRALGILARRDLERGRHDQAVEGFRSILRRDPARWDRRVSEVLSLGLALFRAGRAQDLGVLAADVEKRVAGEAGRALSERLVGLSAAAPPEDPPPTWIRRLGVDAGGRGVTRTAVGEVPLIWSVPLPHRPWRSADPANPFRNKSGQHVNDILEDASRPLHPSVVGDRVFLHDGVTFSCYDLLAGDKPLWSATSNYFGRGAGGWNFEPNRAYSVTVGDGILYVLSEVPGVAHDMPIDAKQYQGFEVIPNIPRRRLTALDARTGRVLWAVGARELPVSFLDSVSFSMEPLLLDGRLYLPGAVFEGIPTVFMLCIDALDGGLVWSRRICAGSQELNMFGRAVREYCGSGVAAAGDALYFCTNLGAVASLRASDGAWRWLFRYRPRDKPPSETFQTLKVPPCWAPGVVTATGDRVVVAPSDAFGLYALDPDSGACRWMVSGEDDARWGYTPRRRGGNSWLNGPYWLLGVAQDRVVVHGNAVEAYHVRSGKLLWRSLFGTDEEKPAGRGALAGDRVVVPTSAGLYVFDARSGKTERYTAWTGPKARSMGGNVAVAGGYLLTASADSLNCFCDRALLEERIRAAAAQNPNDPEAALRAARILRKNDSLEEALRYYRRVLELAAADSVEGREATGGIYDVLRDLSALAWKRGDHDQALKALRAALEYAPSDEARISTWNAILEGQRRAGRSADAVETYRVLIRQFAGVPYPLEGDPVATDAWARYHLAKHFASEGRPAEAVAEYQVLVETGGDTPLRAGALRGTARSLAREAIENLVLVHGRGVYAPFDEKAEALFASGRASGDPAPFAALLDRYPNALRFPDALLALADARAARGEFEEAAGTYKIYLRDYPRAPETPAALVRLVAVLEKLDRRFEARRVLQRLRKRFPFVEIETGTGTRKAGEWAEEVLARPEYRQAREEVVRQDLLWKEGRPLWETAFSQPPSLIATEGTPPDDLAPFALVGEGQARLKAVSVEDGRVLWTVTGLADPRRAAYAGRVLLVEWLGHISGLDVETGAERWKRSFPNGGLVKGMAVKGDVAAAMVSVGGRGPETLWFFALDPETGADLFPPRNLEQWGGISTPRIGVEVAVAYIAEGTARIFGFDLVDGRELFAHPVDGWLLCPPVLFETKRRVVYCTLDAVVGLDLAGQTAWSFKVRGLDRDSARALGDAVTVTRVADNGRYEVLAFRAEDGALLWRQLTKLSGLTFREGVGDALFVVGNERRETVLLALDKETGETEAKALLNDQNATSVVVQLGARVGLAKVSWRQGAGFLAAFRVFDLASGKILHTLDIPEGNLSAWFDVVDGRLVYTHREKLLCWGGKD